MFKASNFNSLPQRQRERAGGTWKASCLWYLGHVWGRPGAPPFSVLESSPRGILSFRAVVVASCLLGQEVLRDDRVFMTISGLLSNILNPPCEWEQKA